MAQPNGTRSLALVVDDPAPPPGHGQHRYRFTAYALSEHIDLDAGATREALDAHLEPVTLGTARLTGTYRRE